MIVTIGKEEHAVHEDDRKMRLFHVDYAQHVQGDLYNVDSILRKDALKLVASGKSSLVLCNDSDFAPRDAEQLVNLCSAFGYVDDDCKHMICVNSFNSLESYDAALRFANDAGLRFVLVADACESGELPQSFYDNADCVYDDNKALSGQWKLRKYPTGSHHINRIRSVIWGSCASTLVWCVSKFNDEQERLGNLTGYHDMVNAYGRDTIRALLGQWELGWNDDTKFVLSSKDYTTVHWHIYALGDDERRLLYLTNGIRDIIEITCADRLPFGIPEYIGVDEYNEKLTAVYELMSETCINEQIELLLSGVPIEDIMA